jgi:hypothetical protein
MHSTFTKFVFPTEEKCIHRLVCGTCLKLSIVRDLRFVVPDGRIV